MSKEWQRLKEETHVVFTAAAVSLLASVIFNHPTVRFNSNEFGNILINCLVSSLLAVGSVYFILWLWFEKVNKN